MKQIFIWAVRIYYEDTDAGGIVYHANYLKFFERARTEMLRELGLSQNVLTAEQQVIFAVRSAQVEYLQPARFDEQLQINTMISQLKSASIIFQQQLLREKALLSTATLRIACIDAKSMRPKIIPKNLQLKLK